MAWLTNSMVLDIMDHLSELAFGRYTLWRSYGSTAEFEWRVRRVMIRQGKRGIDLPWVGPEGDKRMGMAYRYHWELAWDECITLAILGQWWCCKGGNGIWDGLYTFGRQWDYGIMLHGEVSDWPAVTYCQFWLGTPRSHMGKRFLRRRKRGKGSNWHGTLAWLVMRLMSILWHLDNEFIFCLMMLAYRWNRGMHGKGYGIMIT